MMCDFQQNIKDKAGGTGRKRDIKVSGDDDTSSIEDDYEGVVDPVLQVTPARAQRARRRSARQSAFELE